MDCETARLFLHFDRPGERDLDGPEADELHAHLEQCSACHSLALGAHRLDQHLSRAMRAVEVPSGLKGRLLERLAADRRIVKRRRLGKLTRVLAVAACLLLLVWAGYAVFNPTRKSISADQIAIAYNVGGRDQDRVNDALKRLGASACAPGFVNYAHLSAAPALADLPYYEKKVPQLSFINQRRPVLHATIWVIDNNRFKVEDLGASTQSYPEKLEVEHRGRYTYLILYNGNNWDWLRKDED
jgi:hypothetical protein